ncbi:MAG TPA: hypothetical protein DDZ43_09590, partial [Hyphomonadaceae bacterium]|nr:hypothetical protein [Hyphomonadaceae bacterium]
MRFNTCLAIAATSLAISVPALAQSTGSTPPPPCTDEAYHQFDFWLGEWEVSGPNGNLAGH